MRRVQGHSNRSATRQWDSERTKLMGEYGKLCKKIFQSPGTYVSILKEYISALPNHVKMDTVLARLFITMSRKN